MHVHTYTHTHTHSLSLSLSLSLPISLNLPSKQHAYSHATVLPTKQSDTYVCTPEQQGGARRATQVYGRSRTRLGYEKWAVKSRAPCSWSCLFAHWPTHHLGPPQACDSLPPLRRESDTQIYCTMNVWCVSSRRLSSSFILGTASKSPSYLALFHFFLHNEHFSFVCCSFLFLCMSSEVRQQLGETLPEQPFSWQYINTAEALRWHHPKDHLDQTAALS